MGKIKFVNYSLTNTSLTLVFNSCFTYKNLSQIDTVNEVYDIFAR